MNRILQIKAEFEQKSNTGGFSARHIPANKIVEASHLQTLRNELNSVVQYWQENTIINKVLVTAYYIDVIAKSNRIQSLLSEKGKKTNDLIVGAKFSKDKDPKHIITYCMENKSLVESLKMIDEAISILIDDFDGKLTNEQISAIMHNEIPFKSDVMSKNCFINIVADSVYLEKLDVDKDRPELTESQVITLYDIGIPYREIFRKIDLDYLNINKFDDNTFLLNPTQYSILKNSAPYLIAMATPDFSKYVFADISDAEIDKDIPIPEPTNEPVIGVIDTLFDKSVYFSKWVDYVKLVDTNITTTWEDEHHGTMVDSIIVDGPTLNKDIDDGCGRFRVRHFGVAAGKKYSVFTLLRQIRDIVQTNRDIHVWNLSLGAESEIEDNFISPVAALLDNLQYDYPDIIFIVAGTNKTSKNQVKIGSPADSINSIVVNSVSFDNLPASYTRKGPVLSFFTKPDVSYYGGDSSKEMNVYFSNGKVVRTGTSFAAPWIARKMAYMMQVMGLSREVSKALLIDCAAGWNKQNSSSYEIGFGIVPVKITDILQSKDDEIRFFLSGTSEKWDTYLYNIPVPAVNDNHPFIAKATLCYFPKCFRNQGVDYTTTELDLHFGRIKDDGSIASINENLQNETDNVFTKESNARDLFRKWDNVKHIGEFEETKHRPKKAYKTKSWGISLKTTERLSEKYGKDLKFGIVLTLKELYGKNRIQEFIQLCQLRGWLVNKIDIENQIDIYNKADVEIDFEE